MQSENIGWEIAKVVMNPLHQAQVIPKNVSELIYDFMRAYPAEKSIQLHDFIKNQIGESLNDTSILNRIGLTQISGGLNSDWGIALLNLNTMLFPDDGNLWDSLGEGYLLLGDKENARLNFKKALELGQEKECHWCKNSQKKLILIQSNPNLN
ncbi:tetratricopeptide repeat protein [Cyclobacterium lianum]|nr:hypothetical protein [Cyclobacterium lianum]